MPVIFISHSSKDKTDAEYLREELREAGFQDVFIDNHSILPGQQWETLLYQKLRSCAAVIALISQHFNESKWCFAELTHAKSLGRPIIPLLLDDAELPPILRYAQFQSTTIDRQKLLTKLVAGLEAIGIRANDSMAWNPTRPPYPGLSAFDAEDAGVYFGREKDIRAILDRIHDLTTFGSAPRSLIVLGASGTGKSSLLRAGILPKLRLDPRRWLVLPPVRPSLDPLTKLTEAISALLATSPRPRTPSQLNEDFKSQDELRATLRALVADDAGPTIIVMIDQLEELTSPAAKDGLPAWLINVLGIDYPRIIVLGTLRSDRVASVEKTVPLLMRGRLVTIAPLSESELLRTITGPAETAGLQLDPDLAQELLQDVRARQALPLLAFALRELWERRSPEGRLLTLSYVSDLGRIEGAVKRAAEAATKSVIDSPAETEALRLALLEMVQISTDGSLLKRRTLRSDLPSQSSRGIGALEAARLLVADGDFVEPAHEALFGAWSRLAEWVKEARAALMVRTEAQTDAALWESSGQRYEYLWAEARLDRAKRLLATQRLGITGKTARFLESSTKAVEELHRKELAERDRELTRLRRQRLIVGSFAAGALAAAAVAISFYFVARNAEAESNISLRTSRLQTARVACRDVTVGARDTGIEALQEAAKIRPGDDLRTALVDCLQRPGLRELIDRRDGSEPSSIRSGAPLVDQVGKTKATLRPAAEKDKFIISVERDGAALAAWPLVASEADSLRLSPDGSMVAVMWQSFGMADQTMDVFESRTGKKLWSFRVETAGLGHWSASAGRISFSASGRYIAAAGNAGSVLAWDLSSTNAPAAALQARPFSDQAILTAVSPDGRWVAAMDEKHNLVVVEMETNDVVAAAPLAGTMQEFNSLALEWTSQDRIVAGAKQWQWLQPVDRGFWARSNIGRQRSIRDVVFDLQGTKLGIATEYGGPPYVGDISGRDAKIRKPFESLEFPSGLESLAFSDSTGSVCGAQLSAILCWQLNSGAAEVLSGNDFSRRYRQLNADDDRVVAAGEREITVIEALDIKGNLLWQRTLERTSMFGLKAVFDHSGQRLMFRSTDKSTSFDVITLADGATVQSFREDDPNETLVPIDFGEGFALLDGSDLSIRRLEDGEVVAGPYAPTHADYSNSDIAMRGKAIVERSRTGQLTFWIIGGGQCSLQGIVQPRNQAIALSSSGAHFAAFDGEVLKVWDTTTCMAVEVPTSEDGSSVKNLAFTPNDREIRFRNASNEITTYVLGTKQVSRTAIKQFADCEFEAGSGWSGDAGTVWRACNAGKSIIVKAWRAADGSPDFEVTLGAESQERVTVLIDPKQHAIIVSRGRTKPGIWGWSLPGGSATETDLCKSAAIEGSANVQLFDRGTKAAFLSQGGKDGAQIDLNIVDTGSCKSTSVMLPSANSLLGTTSSGGFVVATGASIQAVSRDGRFEWISLENAGRIRRAAMSTDGKLVAAAFDDGSIAVGNARRAQPIFRFKTGPGEVKTLAFSPDGSWLAAGTEAGRVHLWPLAALEADVAKIFGVGHP